MTADEYLALPEDLLFRYELVDGVVFMSPSPTFDHQRIGAEVVAQIVQFLRKNPIGEVAYEVDVRLGDHLVYRPDVVFLRSDKAAKCGRAITEVPDLVVEIVSPDSRSYDSRTKRADYEEAGVGEYWLIDPDRETFQFFVLEQGTFRESPASGDIYRSSVLPGFALDLASIRRLI